jgi:predicted O-methyltransferase YrrM
MAKIRNPLPLSIKWSGPDRREYFLDHLIKTNGWTIGIEVGVRVGRTLFHLLDNNPDLKMYAVDKDIKQFYNDTIKNKYNSRLIVLEGISWDQASLIPDTVDFVFIDASHSTKSVIKDINAYKPLLKNNKGLTGHDIDFPAVQAALAELKIEVDVGPDNTWIKK